MFLTHDVSLLDGELNENEITTLCVAKINVNDQGSKERTFYQDYAMFKWNIKISKKVRNRKVKSSELAAQYGSHEFNQRFFMRLLKVTEFLESRDWAEAVICKQCGGVRVKKDGDIKGNPATATLKPPSRIVRSARTFTDLCTAVSQRAKAREEICGLKGSVRDPARSVAWLNKLDDGHHDAILMGESDKIKAPPSVTANRLQVPQTYVTKAVRKYMEACGWCEKTEEERKKQLEAQEVLRQGGRKRKATSQTTDEGAKQLVLRGKVVDDEAGESKGAEDMGEPTLYPIQPGSHDRWATGVHPITAQLGPHPQQMGMKKSHAVYPIPSLLLQQLFQHLTLLRERSREDRRPALDSVMVAREDALRDSTLEWWDQ
ncbi:hypothetical protein CYMTET_11682 [Cymbomonas tetramitiformis]|uniref:Uncharacterized protein n=1 Tax=Cymbomonas tetramitiformis TaxID=36881 RepID=A0AAE0GLS3_9CHLO|nr:hypothetical protein CYMTET_11682 [Cymbomonas tetramitiformis]